MDPLPYIELPYWYKDTNKTGKNKTHNVQETVKGTGKPNISKTWSLLTDEINPTKGISSKCKHCMMVVRHYKRVRSIEYHLRGCYRFIRAIQGLDISHHPSWLMKRKIVHNHGKTRCKAVKQDTN
jgi:hypothetical protein